MSGKTVFVALQEFSAGSDLPRRTLEQAGFRVEFNSLGRRLQREEMPRLLREADAVLAGVEPYDGNLLRSLTRLRCISRCGVGTDSIDLPVARELGVAVLTTPEEVVQAVAEMTLGMILALARNLPLHLRELERGTWKKHGGHLLSEWTIGLVGFGRIGQAVERLLRPFSCRVLVADPFKNQEGMPAGVRWEGLDQLLSESDVVSLHAALPPGQPPLLGGPELARMKKGSFLVNTARGSLVNERALEQALRLEQLAGAALDVFEAEPYAGPLASLPQVLCTPHVATLTRKSRTEMELRCVRNVIDFFSNGGGNR